MRCESPAVRKRRRAPLAAALQITGGTFRAPSLCCCRPLLCSSPAGGATQQPTAATERDTAASQQAAAATEQGTAGTKQHPATTQQRAATAENAHSHSPPQRFTPSPAGNAPLPRPKIFSTRPAIALIASANTRQRGSNLDTGAEKRTPRSHEDYGIRRLIRRVALPILVAC